MKSQFDFLEFSSKVGLYIEVGILSLCLLYGDIHFAPRGAPSTIQEFPMSSFAEITCENIAIVESYRIKNKFRYR